MEHMGVDHRGFDILVPEAFLDVLPPASSG